MIDVLFSFKTQLCDVKRILAEAEVSVRRETSKRKEANEKIVQLIEARAQLQRQLTSTAGSSVAEKQVF